MVLGKMKKALKRSLTIAVVAAVMATSVPQLSMSVMAKTLDGSEQKQETAGNLENENKDSEGEGAEEENEGEGTDEGSEDEGTDEGNEGESAEEENEGEGNESEGTEEENEGDSSDKSAFEDEKDEKKDTKSADLKETKKQTASDTAADNKAMRYMIEPTEEWKDYIQEDITGFSEVIPLKSNYRIQYDLYLPAEADFTGSFYIKPVLKLGDDWTWTEGNSEDGKSVTREEFTACEEDETLVKYTYSGRIGEDETAVEEYIAAIVAAAGSGSCNYDGVMFLDNVSLLDENGEVLACQNFNEYEGSVLLGSMDGIESGSEGEGDHNEDTDHYYL